MKIRIQSIDWLQEEGHIIARNNIQNYSLYLTKKFNVGTCKGLDLQLNNEKVTSFMKSIDQTNAKKQKQKTM